MLAWIDKRNPKIIKMMRYQGIEPDLFTYTILVTAHCEGGDVEEGMKIRKDILDQGLQLNIVTYSVLLNALFKKVCSMRLKTYLVRCAILVWIWMSLHILSSSTGIASKDKLEERLKCAM